VCRVSLCAREPNACLLIFRVWRRVFPFFPLSSFSPEFQVVRRAVSAMKARTLERKRRRPSRTAITGPSLAARSLTTYIYIYTRLLHTQKRRKKRRERQFERYYSAYILERGEREWHRHGELLIARAAKRSVQRKSDLARHQRFLSSFIQIMNRCNR